MGRGSGQARIHLFGSLLVRLGPGELGPRDLGGVKPKQVLEILVAGRGHPVPTDRLVEYLWEEARPRDPTAAVVNYVSIVRSRLSMNGTAGRDLVLTVRGGYRFAAERAWVDLDRFDDLVARARAQDPGRARRSLEGALALVRGEVLEDEPYSTWAERVRQDYRPRVMQALLDAADAALADEDWSGALGHARGAQEAEPLNERGCRATMTALYALGDQEGALAAFHRCREGLREELGVDPLPETVALYQAILRHRDPRSMVPNGLRTTSPGFRKLVEQRAGAYWWTTDEAMNVTALSGPSFGEAGVPPDDASGRTVGELFGAREDDHPALEAHRQALSGTPATRRFRWGERILESHVEPLRDRRGETVGTVGVALDVTGPHGLEAALVGAGLDAGPMEEELFRDMYREAPVPYLSTDMTGHIVMANREAQSLLGYGRDELVGREIWTLHAPTPGGRGRARRMYERFKAGEQIAGEEVELRAADGRSVWVSVSIRPVRDRSGRVVRSRTILVDVTRRKRERELLRRSEQRLRGVVEHLSDGILVVDPSGDRILEANPRACEILGYARRELLRRRPSDIHPHEMPRFLAFMRSSSERGRGWTDDLHCSAKSGRLIPVEMSAWRLHVAGEPLIAVLLRELPAGREADPELARRLQVVGSG
ncbi:MAG: PAS domain S-box protein [Actinobacteria bacterium]|nr:PAS domain S-box protein [Actinomycetota bacterium]